MLVQGTWQQYKAGSSIGEIELSRHILNLGIILSVRVLIIYLHSYAKGVDEILIRGNKGCCIF